MKTITTTIKWRNAKKELPKESCQVVAWIPSSGYCTTLQYSERHRKFNCGDWVDKKLAVRVAINVDYWCYLDEIRMALTTFPEEKPQAMRRVDGEELSDYICPTCGNPFMGSRYCDHCGQRLEW